MAPGTQAFMGVGGVRCLRRTSSDDQCPLLGPGSLAFPGNECKGHSPATSACGQSSAFPASGPGGPTACACAAARQKNVRVCHRQQQKQDSNHLRTVKGRPFARSDPVVFARPRDLAQRHARVCPWKGKVGSSAAASGREWHRRWVEALNMSAKTESRRSSRH